MQLVLSRLLALLHVLPVHPAVPLVPVRRPAQLVTLDLDFQQVLVLSVLLINFQLEALLLVPHAQLALSQLLELKVAPLAQPAVPPVPVLHHAQHVM